MAFKVFGKKKLLIASFLIIVVVSVNIFSAVQDCYKAVATAIYRESKCAKRILILGVMDDVLVELIRSLYSSASLQRAAFDYDSEIEWKNFAVKSGPFDLVVSVNLASTVKNPKVLFHGSNDVLTDDGIVYHCDACQFPFAVLNDDAGGIFYQYVRRKWSIAIQDFSIQRPRTVLPASAVITALPDGGSLPYNHSYEEYEDWFCTCLDKIIRELLPEDGLLFLSQTESIFQGRMTMKAEWCRKVAQQHGLRLVWHKIYYAETSSRKWSNCTYAWCFSRRDIVHPDSVHEVVVTPEPPEKTIGFCQEFTTEVLEICRNNDIEILVDPMCGYAQLLLRAWNNGFGAIGRDIMPYCLIDPFSREKEHLVSIA